MGLKYFWAILSFILMLVPLQPRHVFSTSENPSLIQVTPVFEQILVDPGQTVHKRIKLSNLSSLALPIKAYTRGFVATDEVGGADFPIVEQPDAAQNWLTFDSSEFILEPHSDKEVLITVTVPMQAAAGGHYASIFFETLSPKLLNEDETGLMLSSRIGVFYFFEVTGEIIRQAKLSDFKTSKLWQDGSVKFNLRFHNTGNIHIRPQSDIQIYKKNKIVASVNDSGQTILPDKYRQWQISLNKSLPLGFYKARLYTTVAGAGSITKDVWFVVFPANRVGLGLVLVASTLLLLKGRKRIKRAVRTFVE